MNTTTVSSDTDRRCGAYWLAKLDSAGRTELLVALLSRFNHDLRTPLNTILGWTHLLQKGELDTVRARHVADVIARNSRDQTQLLEDFVDDGRAILDVLQLQLAALKMDDPLTEAIGRLGSLLTLHGVSLQTKFDTADVSVTGDVHRLTRLVYRLLVIVTRRAREATTVEIETDVDRGRYVLALSGTAYEPDWSEAALLDLRISTLIAALHDGELQVGADSTRPCIAFRIRISHVPT
jgi:signal transduction histidine kinase